MKSLPNGWHLVELEKVCSLPQRQVRPSDFSKYDYYVGLEHIEGSTGRVIEYKKVADANLKSSKFHFDTICILYGKLRPYLNKVALPTVTGICSTDILPLKPVTEAISKEFLFYFLRSPSFVKVATEKSTGANLPRISPEVLMRIPIPLPPLKTQNKVAQALTKADQLRQTREKANQLTNKIIQSVFLKMFGHPIVNPRGWPHRKIGEISQVVRGSSPRPKGDPRYFGGPVPRLMIADITRDGTPVYPQIDSLTDEGARRSRPVKKGTLVIAVSGDVGLTSIVGVDCCIHDGFVALLDLDKSINPLFLNTYLEFMRQTNLERSSGAIWRNLTTHEIRDINVIAPPVKLQDHFADIVESIQGIRRSQANSRQEIDELFHSLTEKVFTGQLVA